MRGSLTWGSGCWPGLWWNRTLLLDAGCGYSEKERRGPWGYAGQAQATLGGMW